jgi:hypothetical protein
MNKRVAKIVAQYVIPMPRSKSTKPSIMTRFVASPAVKAVGDLVLLVIMLGFVFLIAFFLAGCFSDTDPHTSYGSSSSSSSSQWTESDETGFDPGSHETPDGSTSTSEPTLVTSELTSTGMTTTEPVSSTSGNGTSTSGPNSVTSEPTSAEMTTTEPVSPWYHPCYSNFDCPAPLFCSPNSMSTIGKGHCTNDCVCADPGNSLSCGDNSCPQPTSGGVAPWCSGHCWLFLSVTPCQFLDCPDDLVCHELDFSGPKSVCAAP